jgi:hypothetical protein
MDCLPCAGIVNGVDIDEWDPATDENIATHYWPGNMDGKKECKVRECDGGPIASAPAPGELLMGCWGWLSAQAESAAARAGL